MRLACSLILMLTLLPAAASERSPIAFVGSVLDWRELPCESQAQASERMARACRESRFEASYRVEQVLEGEINRGSELRFVVADHYGTPRFAQFRSVVLFLYLDAGELRHLPYEWAPAYLTSTGRYADCGCSEFAEGGLTGHPQLQGRLDWPGESACRELIFVPRVAVDLSHASPQRIAEFHADPDYRVSSHWADCVRGLYVEDLYELRRPMLIERLLSRE
jgi:hypothetical protein